MCFIPSLFQSNKILIYCAVSHSIWKNGVALYLFVGKLRVEDNKIF